MELYSQIILRESSKDSEEEIFWEDLDSYTDVMSDFEDK